VWESSVFSFISGTPLVNLTYGLMLGVKISPYATICYPIRIPDLVTIGAFSSIDGLLQCHSVSPLGVSFSPIVIADHCSISNYAVIQPGAIIEENVRLEPVSVVPKFTKCEANYNWGGKPCQRGEPRSPLNEETKRNVPPFRWLMEKTFKTFVIFTLPYGSMISLACANRFWFVLFPAQPVSNRIGNFWFSIWLYYGTLLGWAIFALLFKWIVFGKAKPGPYNPNFIMKVLRWTLGYYTSMVEGMLLSQFYFPVVHIWSRLMGNKIHPTATSYALRLGGNPVDADLIEIQEGASVSWVDTSCYNSEENVRSPITIEKNAQVWLWASLDAGAAIKQNSVVSAGVYVANDRIIESNSIISDSSCGSFTKKETMTNAKKKEVIENDSSQVYIPNVVPGFNPFLNIFFLLLDVIVIISGIMPFWLCYYLYRECLTQGHIAQWQTLTIVIVFGLVLLITCHALVNRVFHCTQYLEKVFPSITPFVRFLIWKMIHQYRLMLGFFYLPWSGSLLLNSMINISGGNVHLSAKLFNAKSITDWSVTEVGEFAVVAEDSYLLGHRLKNKSLVVKKVCCERFSCLEPFSLPFAGQTMKSWSCLGSFTSVSSNELKEGYYKLGGRMTTNPLFDNQSEVESNKEFLLLV
jgi:carbonic anhydrase/acetyltransferase-like protein (isoleucine patch superfamily)